MIKELLLKLQFTAYEREIITYLASTKNSIAKEIYKNTKIPKGRIYSVLQDLEEKGIINIVPTNPKKYFIDDVKKRLEKFIEKEQETLQLIVNETRQLKIEKKIEEKKTPSVTYHTGREKHINATTQLRNTAKKEILQIGPHFKGTIKSAKSYVEALERGVSVKVITKPKNIINKNMVETILKRKGKIKFTEEGLFPLLIVDGKKVIFGVQNDENNEERMMIESESKVLAQAMRKSFMDLWNSK